MHLSGETAVPGAAFEKVAPLCEPLFGVRGVDLDQMSGVRQGWNLECTQLCRGPGTADLVRLVTPQVKIGFESVGAGCRIRGDMCVRQLQFMLLVAEEKPFRLWGKEYDREVLVFFGPKAHLELTTRSGIRAEGIVIPPNSFEELFIGEPSSQELIDGCEKHPGMVVDAPRALRDAFRRLTAGVKEMDWADRSVRQTARVLGGRALSMAARALLATTESCPTRQRTAHKKRRAAALAAEDYMRRDFAAPVTSQDLCRCAGVSERTLELAFREEFGVSPRGYLKVLRLNAARSLIGEYALQGLKDPVTQAAWDAGWLHLGRFAHAYRALFGEYPQEKVRWGRNGNKRPVS